MRKNASYHTTGRYKSLPLPTGERAGVRGRSRRINAASHPTSGHALSAGKQATGPLLAWLAAACLLLPAAVCEAAESASAVEQRLASSAKLLASDRLEGRGVGTDGLEMAADYIHQQFKSAGLKTELLDGTPFQSFTVTTSARLGKVNELKFIAPDSVEKRQSKSEKTKQPESEESKPSPDVAALVQGKSLKLGKDFSPLAIGGSNRFHAPLVFAGYGITSRKANYDDYADIDAKGKVVILLRHEPQQNNPHSAFDGTEHSRHAFFSTKVSNAYQHGAVAVILVNDKVEIERRVAAARRRWQAAIDALIKAHEEFREIEDATREQLEEHRRAVAKFTKQIERYSQAIAKEYDPVFSFQRAGNDAERPDMPVLHVRREILDAVMRQATGKGLDAYEEEIDKGPTPQSVELVGWRVVGQTDIEREEVTIKNVLGVLEGEGPRADETVIVGAHYDHLGFGGPGSAAPKSNEVHNGADDNASGTAVLIEVARRLASRGEPLPRRVVFIAFTGEERGLLGSAHYARNPLYPLEKTVAMLNMDMVGRLQENKLIVSGVKTAAEFEAWLDELNSGESGPGFKLVKKPSGFGPSDHATFYAKQIPVLHFFTGSHPDYHKPSDDYAKLDIAGMRRTADLVTGMAVRVAASDEKPTYQQTKQQVARRGGTRPYLGSIPEFRSDAEGYAISGVAKDSPAERAGLQGGDVIIQFGKYKIGNLRDIDGALRKYKAGDNVKVVVRRDGEEVPLEVVLDPPQ